jgi:hypothetical protein
VQLYEADAQRLARETENRRAAPADAAATGAATTGFLVFAALLLGAVAACARRPRRRAQPARRSAAAPAGGAASRERLTGPPSTQPHQHRYQELRRTCHAFETSRRRAARRLATGPGAALAQTQGSATAPPAVRTDGNPNAGTPVPGSNSFTEGQARGRIEDAGFRDVSDLTKDDQGIWRGRATRGGAQTSVALDYQGNVFGGTAAAGVRRAQPPRRRRATARPATRPAPPRAAPRTARSARTPQGRPPVATGRTGRQATRPARRPGAPRTRALGTNTTGANPGGDRPDGASGNPPSTAAGRAVDRAQGQAPQPDGTPGNPAGTAAGRAADRALGTNATGANPGASSPAR